MQVDYFDVFWQAVVSALAIYSDAFARNPWPWLAIAGFFALLIALRVMLPGRRRRVRR